MRPVLHGIPRYSQLPTASAISSRGRGNTDPLRQTTVAQPSIHLKRL
ncbi:hypothetical protein AtDm6_3251 [Acetobacter tropicalis]|uniref:Uncharacterized protein n=1 Tax=Acetobacter tropicalis TaxID=104102 RepID=A0A094ZEP2_9PROT|nr:hypothetical protein AtDm6_3251 [Acetobacter tropicalis]